MPYNDHYFFSRRKIKKQTKKQSKKRRNVKRKASKKKRTQRRKKIVLTSAEDVKHLISSFPKYALDSQQREPVIHEKGSSWSVEASGKQFEIPKEVIDKQLNKVFERIKDNQINDLLKSKDARMGLMSTLVRMANDPNIKVHGAPLRKQFLKFYEDLQEVEEHIHHIWMGLDEQDKNKYKDTENEKTRDAYKKIQGVAGDIEASDDDDASYRSSLHSSSQFAPRHTASRHTSSRHLDIPPPPSTDRLSTRASSLHTERHDRSDHSDRDDDSDVNDFSSSHNIAMPGRVKQSVMRSRIERTARPTRGLIPGQESTHTVGRTRLPPLSSYSIGVGTPRSTRSVGFEVAPMTQSVGVGTNAGEFINQPSIHSSRAPDALMATLASVPRPIPRPVSSLFRRIPFDQRFNRASVNTSLPPVAAETMQSSVGQRFQEHLEDPLMRDVTDPNRIHPDVASHLRRRIDELSAEPMRDSRFRGSPPARQPPTRIAADRRSTREPSPRRHGEWESEHLLRTEFSQPHSGSGRSNAKVQAVLFDKDLWDTDAAQAWLKKHHHKPIKQVHETANLYRYRLRQPDPRRFNYRNHKLPDTKRSISFVLEYPK